MNAAELTNQYLADGYTMQLATMSVRKPWICTVYFVADAEKNLYWASLPTRRHSRDIKANADVAAAIVVKNVVGEPVIGIQVEGTAEELAPASYARGVVSDYAAKFKRGDQWQEDFSTGSTEHRLYKLTPVSLFLFDEQHFPGGERQKII